MPFKDKSKRSGVNSECLVENNLINFRIKTLALLSSQTNDRSTIRKLLSNNGGNNITPGLQRNDRFNSGKLVQDSKTVLENRIKKGLSRNTRKRKRNSQINRVALRSDVSVRIVPVQRPKKRAKTKTNRFRFRNEIPRGIPTRRVGESPLSPVKSPKERSGNKPVINKDPCFRGNSLRNLRKTVKP